MKKLFVLLTVFAAAGCGNLLNPDSSDTGTGSSSTSSAVVYTAIGASDANGVGSSVVCIPYSVCPDGKGYVPELVRRLQAAGKTVQLQNLGFPGAVLSPSIQTFGNSLGRGIALNFLQDEMPFVRTDATLVTIFAGGNDANAIGAGVRAGLGGSDPTTWANVQVAQFGRDMTSMITGIKTLAPKARIVILNLPNLAALPYAAGYSTDDRRVLQTISVGLNAQVNAATSQGATVIDLMCNSQMYNSQIFSSDGFHPNDSGYSLFTDLLFSTVTTSSAAATAPKASCSFMSVY